MNPLFSCYIHLHKILQRTSHIQIDGTAGNCFNLAEKELEDIDGMGRDVIEFAATGENGVIEPLGLGFLRVENTV